MATYCFQCSDGRTRRVVRIRRSASNRAELLLEAFCIASDFIRADLITHGWRDDYEPKCVVVAGTSMVHSSVELHLAPGVWFTTALRGVLGRASGRNYFKVNIGTVLRSTCATR